jgi:hypothetical protein
VISVIIGPQIAAGGGDDALTRQIALTYTAIVFTVADLLAFAIVPGLIVSKARQRIAAGTWQPPQPQGAAVSARFAQFLEETGDAGKLMTVLNMRTIIAAALLESLGFFWLIVHLLTNTPLSLIAAIALIIGVALHFPTRARVTHWIEDQLRRVEQQRQFGR